MSLSSATQWVCWLGLYETTKTQPDSKIDRGGQEREKGSQRSICTFTAALSTTAGTQLCVSDKCTEKKMRYAFCIIYFMIHILWYMFNPNREGNSD